MMSGCFGSGATDGQDAGETDSGGGGTTTTTNTLNHPPVISINTHGNLGAIEASDCTTSGFSIDLYHAMTDWDGSIVLAGWDIDLDGSIDYQVTDSEGYTTVTIPLNEFVTPDNHTLKAGIVFGAQDNGGAWTSSDILVTTQYQVNVDIESCPDFTNPADYTFSFADHSDSISDGSTDDLVTITRTNGQVGILWESIIIRYEGDESDRICRTPDSSNTDCVISAQSGTDDLFWEPSETITLSEGGHHLQDNANETARIEIFFGNTQLMESADVTVY